MGRRNLSTEQRLAEFWARVDRRGEDECWEWTGWRYPKGYGRCTPLEVNGERYTHRASYQLHVGKIPKGMCVCHECDNPPCVNPKHFFLGTRGDNNRDTQRKGRAYSHFRGVTHCIHGHELTPDNVRVSKTGRHCRMCSRAFTAAHRLTPKGKASALRNSRKRLADPVRKARRSALQKARYAVRAASDPNFLAERNRKAREWYAHRSAK